MPPYRAINLTLAVLFAVFAGTQFDGTEPVRAALVYGTGSLVCGLAAADRAPPPTITQLFAALCVGLALVSGLPFVLARGGGRLPSWDEVEGARQAVALILIAGWMAVVASVASRSTPRSVAPDR